ncbi:MAG: translation initiation factor IF-2 subunit beta [Candidatus Nanohaloarchaea archaeon]|nr:translation initiation factor IF-2 subunit beta [Candidatus Nanohaloarchaea archaeon]
MEDYQSMLDEGMDNLPEEVVEGARFEIPEADTRRDGNKTVLENFAEIASKFGRDQKHFSKYLLKELGTAGHVEGRELILQGKFRRGVVNSKIENYCEEYVLCSECNRPDTEIRKEKGVLLLKCEACGARESLEE